MWNVHVGEILITELGYVLTVLHGTYPHLLMLHDVYELNALYMHTRYTYTCL